MSEFLTNLLSTPDTSALLVLAALALLLAGDLATAPKQPND